MEIPEKKETVKASVRYNMGLKRTKPFWATLKGE